jgi:SAM-dependent methyltransferase
LHPEYNPGGHGSAAEFSFPYPERSFDLVIATSVFTHLLPDVADHYLEEAARVLAPGGRLFATWFLLDPEHPPEPSRAMVTFSHPRGAAAVADPNAPEAAVAYPLPRVRERLSGHGLKLREPVYVGSWSGHPGRSSQDITVAERAL